MKNIITLIIGLSGAMIFAQDKLVGIETNAPERTLDVNGNVRVTIQQDKPIDPHYTDVLIAEQSGNIDRRSKMSLALTDEQQIETIKNIYYSPNGGIIERSVRCGKYEVSIDSENVALIRSTQPVSKTVTIKYGLRRMERRSKITGDQEGTGTGDYYDKNFQIDFTKDNWNAYQQIYTESKRPMINNDAYRLHVIDPETGDFYKIDLTRIINREEDWTAPSIRNNKASGLRAIICERHFNINN